MNRIKADDEGEQQGNDRQMIEDRSGYTGKSLR